MLMRVGSTNLDVTWINKMARTLTFSLKHSDDDIKEFYESLPKGEKSRIFVEITRAYIARKGRTQDTAEIIDMLVEIRDAIKNGTVVATNQNEGKIGDQVLDKVKAKLSGLGL